MITEGKFSLEVVDSQGRPYHLQSRDKHYYYHVGDGCPYYLRLRNNLNKRASARVQVDGKEVGSFRLDAGETLTLKRPLSRDLGFTFHREDSPISQVAGVVSGKFTNGLIEVTFIPEKEELPVLMAAPLAEARLLPSASTSLEKRSAPTGFQSEALPMRSSRLKASSMRGSPSRAGFQSEASSKRMASEARYESESLEEPSSGATVLMGKTGQEFITVPPMSLDFSGQVTLVARLVIDPSGSCYGRVRERDEGLPSIPSSCPFRNLPSPARCLLRDLPPRWEDLE